MQRWRGLVRLSEVRPLHCKVLSESLDGTVIIVRCIDSLGHADRKNENSTPPKSRDFK
jgi:hypothetical protein